MLNNSIHRSLSNSFDCSHSKTDGIFFIYIKFIKRLIDVRSQNFYPHSFALFHKESDLFDVTHIIRKYRRHILRGVMCLEICCLISNPCITSGVGFIKSIGSKCFPVLPYFIQYLFGMVVSLSSLDELWFKFFQQSEYLFSHCFSQQIGITLRKSRQFLRQ